MSGIGVDSWVEQSDDRTEKAQGWTAPIINLFDSLGPGAKLGIVVVLAAIFPQLVGQGSIRIGITVLLLALLALGLNVVVGWAGLLDLGFVAFYGFGAYFYAIVASDQLPAHWPTWIAIPVIVAASALLGALLSLPAWRLVGDYLAITTLFFAQIFVELVRNFERLPFINDGFDLTGGPNGITGVEPWSVFGFEINSFIRHYYLLLIITAVVVVGLHNLNQSRTGRAWRALREDSLAAQHMTIPVNRLKVSAFAIGAAIAGLTGTIFGAVQVGVFPNNFALPFLITVYAAVILGGSGSIPGVLLGALAIGYIPELLRDPGQAGVLFYLGLVTVLVATVRPWKRLAVMSGGVVAFGFVVRLVVSGFWSEATTGETADARLSRLVDGWVLIMGDKAEGISSLAFVALVGGVMLIVTTKEWTRVAVLIPTIYLAVLVWENKLILQPSVTRQLLFGASLVVMMAIRPQGLLGRRRVEII